ncbi:Intermembrane lipid transfer protein Vps13 [Linum perenne]
MFEGLVHRVVVGYLGRFFKDIQKDQLKLSLWDGRVGRLSIKVSWKKLGWDQPIFIALEDVFICATQRDEQEWCLEEVEKREFAGKMAQLAAAELAKLSRRVGELSDLMLLDLSAENMYIQNILNFCEFVNAKLLDWAKFWLI